MEPDDTGPAPDLRSRMTRIVMDRWVRRVLLALAVICMLAIPGLNFLGKSQQSEGQIAANALPLALQRLERSLGYSGFIHNFKNAILRPGEDSYYTAAAANYDEAISTLNRITVLGQSIGQEFDFSDLVSTLGIYRTGLDVARKAARDGASIHEVDTLVRTPDDEATRDLEAAHNMVRAALNDWLARDAARARLQLVTLSSLFFAIAAILMLFVLSSYFSQRERERQSMELHNRLASLGQLTSGIAHDVNNLLATIYYAVDLTLGETIPDTSRRFLHSAQRAIERGQELTERLLSFARPQPGNAKTLLVSEVFQNVRELALPNLDESLHLRLSEDLPGLTLHCDQSQLENALLNLILNSRDAMQMSGQGNRVTLHAQIHGPEFTPEDSKSGKSVHPRANPGETARPAGQTTRSGFVMLSITDDGPGMPDEVRQRALEPFFTTKGTTSGTGLGLSIVYGFAQSAGGDMQIISSPGKGTTVQILLPRGAEKTREDALEVTRSLSPSGGRRVLLAEDEAGLRELLQITLEQMDYEVVTAENGREALKAVEAGLEFDILLTDIVMPGGVDGFELARRLRAQRPSLPILYLTGNAGPLLGQKVAVHAPVLRKPCHPDRLSAAIAGALTPPETSPG